MADSIRVHAIGTALRERTAQIMRDLVTNLHAELQETTPVDTGWARTNWVPQVGSAFEGTAGTREDAELGRLDHGPAAAGLAQVRQYQQPEQDIHETNNVPYIESLNRGTSAQAPPAFVQTAIVKAIELTVSRENRK